MKRGAEKMPYASEGTATSAWLTLEDDALKGENRKDRKTDAEAPNEEKIGDLNSLKIQAMLLQRSRLLMSAAFWTVLMPAVLLKGAAATAKKHTEQGRGISGHKFGPPHPHIWKKALEDIVEQAMTVTGQTAAQTEALRKMETYIEAYSKDPSKHIFFIKQCTVKMIKNDRAVLTWKLSPLLEEAAQVDKALIVVLEMVGCHVEAGTQAADPMERALQRRIDAKSVAMGKGRGKGDASASTEW